MVSLQSLLGDLGANVQVCVAATVLEQSPGAHLIVRQCWRSMGDMKTTAATAGETVGSSVHCFERAGLGVAPFKFVGCHRSVFQAVPGDPNCPVQPGSSCDYCGQGIMYVCTIQDALGASFKVGCDCVQKTGDAGLVRLVDREIAARRAEQDGARKAKRGADAAALFATEAVRTAMASRPHPKSWAAAKGLTLLDWAEWMLANAGKRGKDEVAKAVLKAAA